MFDSTTIRREGAAFPSRPESQGLHAAILMTRKVVVLLFPAAVAVLVAVGWRDIVRYLKIEQMDLGAGHPELVPAEGLHGYRSPGSGASDGTADFDSASRGGPIRA